MITKQLIKIIPYRNSTGAKLLQFPNTYFPLIMLAAALYDKQGKIFATYPETMDATTFPSKPKDDGFRFAESHLSGYQPVIQSGNRMGTLYLKSDMGAIADRLRSYAEIALAVIAGSSLLGYLLTRKLQAQISAPILALADTARVISERRDYSVRAALSESEGRVRAVLDSALSAVFVTDAQARIIDWNARAEAIFGWNKKETLGRNLPTTILPESGLSDERALQQFLRRGDESVLAIEVTAKRRDGSTFPAEMSVSELKSGDVTTYCGFVTDITERKQSVSKLQTQLARLDLLSKTTRAIGERQDLASICQIVVRSLEDHLPIDFGCVCTYDPARQALTASASRARTLRRTWP